MFPALSELKLDIEKSSFKKTDLAVRREITMNALKDFNESAK